MKKLLFLCVALVLLSGASSRPPSQSPPVMTTPARAGPIINNGGTHPTGTTPIGKANNGTNKPPSGGSCGAVWTRCWTLCNKLYAPGRNVIDGQDSRKRCQNRCDGKYAHCL